jgi:pyruvate dehydrogenase E2 component (dihydrolipoamide acetyltransferase)
MATKVLMEALSPTMEEGRLVEWKKAEGDAVAQGDVLAEVETDKAVMELVARAGGVLLKQLIAAGATAPVASVIGWIGEKGEPVPQDGEGGRTAGRQEAPRGPAEGAASPAPMQPPAAAPASAPAAPLAAAPAAPPAAAPATQPAAAPTEGGRVRASPLARKLASERGLDLTVIRGSGPEGRVVKRDVEAAETAPAGPPGSPAVRPSEARQTAEAPAYEDVPLTQIRKTIAKRLVQSLGPIPTFYLTTEVDMERSADARESLKAELGDDGKVSFNDIILKAVATALRQHRDCNGWWQDDHIRYWNDIHLGMAVATPAGLITPVIRHADRKSLREIGAEAKALAERARERKLTPEEYTGATFTVSNLGMFEIDEFTAIINPPEAGILAVGRMAPTPVIVDGQVAVRRRMRLTMSCDHRVIDGATGAEFLRTLKRMLENPLAMVW